MTAWSRTPALLRREDDPAAVVQTVAALTPVGARDGHLTVPLWVGVTFPG
jgi:hypothetical protein